MRTVSVAFDLFDFSLHFISFLIISLITLHFLLPFTFYFLDVVGYNHAHFRWGGGSPGQKNSSTGHDMEGHAKKWVERYCGLANKTTKQVYKVATPSTDDHQFKEEKMGSVGELSKVSSLILLKSLYLARIGRPDIQWSVNKLARAAKKWTRAWDKRLSRLISYIRHTCDYT